MSLAGWGSWPAMRLVAASLLHFVWQGAVIAAALWLALRYLKKASPRRRYFMACAALLVAVLSPPLTLALLLGNAGNGRSALLTPSAVAAPSSAHSALLVLSWLLGCTLTTSRLARGVRRMQQLTAAAAPAPAALQTRVASLCARLGSSRAIRVLVSSSVDTPLLVGWVKPVVLIPAAALTSLPVSYIEALLAHELGHVQRLDHVANAMQCIAEAVLFYHPAVHWISSRIRIERELCCDEIAVELTESRLVYARALTEMEGLRLQLPKAALASTGGNLMQRIQHVIDPSVPKSSSRLGLLSTALIAGALGASLGGAWACSSEPSPGSSSSASSSSESALSIPWLPDSLTRWAPALAEAADRHGVDPALLSIVALAESQGDPNALSPGGAVGLMQILPATADWIVDERNLPTNAPERLWEPEYNLDLGAWFLARQVAAFGQNQAPERTVELAAIAYNGGPNLVRAHLQDHAALPQETARYRDLVVGMWRERGEATSRTFAAWRER